MCSLHFVVLAPLGASTVEGRGGCSLCLNGSCLFICFIFCNLKIPVICVHFYSTKSVAEVPTFVGALRSATSFCATTTFATCSCQQPESMFNLCVIEFTQLLHQLNFIHFFSV
jgi:hypothetical protein